ALQVRTGVRAWSFPVGAKAINAAPVMEGNLVYVNHGEENIDEPVLGRVVCLDAGTIEHGRPKLVWEEYGVKAGLASPALNGGKRYVPEDGGRLHCYDAKTGKKLWAFRYGRLARGAPVWADGKIYIADVFSRFCILKPEERRCRELYNQEFKSRAAGAQVEVNSTPAVANGKVYFGTREEFYCIGKKG